MLLPFSQVEIIPQLDLLGKLEQALFADQGPVILSIRTSLAKFPLRWKKPRKNRTREKGKSDRPMEAFEKTIGYTYQNKALMNFWIISCKAVL